jgi:hypothetical protein
VDVNSFSTILSSFFDHKLLYDRKFHKFPIKLYSTAHVRRSDELQGKKQTAIRIVGGPNVFCPAL